MHKAIGTELALFGTINYAILGAQFLIYEKLLWIAGLFLHDTYTVSMLGIVQFPTIWYRCIFTIVQFFFKVFIGSNNTSKIRSKYEMY